MQIFMLFYYFLHFYLHMCVFFRIFAPENHTTMKNKIYFLIGIIAAILVTACTPVHRSKDVNADTCLEALKSYFPSPDEQEFVFVNDELGQTWVAKPKGVYPDASKDEYFSITDGESYGSWYARIMAGLETKETSPQKYISTQLYGEVYYQGGEHLIHWDIQVYLGSEKMDGGFNLSCSESEVLPSFTDTIILPVPPQINGKYIVEPSEENKGAYARIVKYQGLTDFSTDGKTVWKRVK